MISTQNLTAMPGPTDLRRIAEAVAMLDAIVCPEWEYRYYSFNSKWSDTEAMASMRNGQGDQWFALFARAGIAIVGLSHESPAFRPGDPWPGIFERLPVAFRENVLLEPAFDTNNASFCLWRQNEDVRWDAGSAGSDPANDVDGSEEMLSILEGRPSDYLQFAREYFEIELSLSAVSTIYNHEPLSDEIVRSLNPDITLLLLKHDISEIGYPTVV
jgi:hypothetical protein